MTPRALIIQDFDGFAFALRRMAEEAGFSCRETDLGEEGLDWARTEDFALYIVDDNLPDMSGFAILRALRRFDSISPAIFTTTAAHDADIVAAAIDHGADAVMAMPCTPAQGAVILRATCASTRGFGPLRRAWEAA